ncbi:MAG: VOC family protein [Thermoanaerobaculia bacterium]|nr:VOC family protein [Thermoanaerobaculia bacterium]
MTMPLPAALHHTCFVVRDLEGTAQRLADALGVGPWAVHTIVPTRSRVHGVETPFTFRVALCAVGGGHFELVSPHTGRSVCDEHLEEHGEGFHHTCLVYPTVEAVRAAKAQLIAQGRECLQEGSADDAFDFAYFQFPEIGSAVEVLFLDPSQLPPPDAVIQPRHLPE